MTCRKYAYINDGDETMEFGNHILQSSCCERVVERPGLEGGGVVDIYKITHAAK